LRVEARDVIFRATGFRRALQDSLASPFFFPSQLPFFSALSGQGPDELPLCAGLQIGLSPPSFQSRFRAGIRLTFFSSLFVFFNGFYSTVARSDNGGALPAPLFSADQRSSPKRACSPSLFFSPFFLVALGLTLSLHIVRLFGFFLYDAGSSPFFFLAARFAISAHRFFFVDLFVPLLVVFLFPPFSLQRTSFSGAAGDARAPRPHRDPLVVSR